MLILTRRVGEALVIGGNVKVLVMGVKGNQVKIGVEAPPDTIVDRAEIHQRRQLSKSTQERNQRSKT